MHPPRTPPPAADTCLVRPYSSRSQKGGTLIAEDVEDLASHLKALADPDRCRPERCAREDCGGHLHVHGRRERRPRQLVVNGTPVTVVEVLVFLCARCRATWRLLPRFLARCLWRTWEVVEQEAQGAPRPLSRPPVPRRTVQRWRSRLVQSARVPLQVLATAGGELLALAQRLHLDSSRLELMHTWAMGAAALAALLHRVCPGVRLM